MVLASDNTDRAKTIVQDGALRLTTQNPVGGEAIRVEGGRVELTGGFNYGNALDLATGGSTLLESVSGNNTWSGPMRLLPFPGYDPRLGYPPVDFGVAVDVGSTLRLTGNITSILNFARLRLGGDGVGTVSAITDAAGRPVSVTKYGSGTWTLTNAFYGGLRENIVADGKLEIGFGAALLGSVEVMTAGTLSGSGAGGSSVSIRGSLSPGSINALQPGSLAEIGTLRFSDFSLLNLIEMQLFKGSSGLIADRAVANNSLILGGTLKVEVLSGSSPLAMGDRFDLFDAFGSVTGSFSAIELPPLPHGLDWDTTNIPVDGTLLIIPEPGTVWLTLMSFGMILGIGRTRRRPQAQVTGSLN